MRCTAALGALFALALHAAGCSRHPIEDDARVLEQLREYRASKDKAFASDESPVPPNRRTTLLPLAYFEPSLEYRVPAVLRPSEGRPTLEMPTSTGKLRKMVRVGRLEFTLQGRPLTLGAFVEAGSRDLDRLFVPFTDLTSGKETYQGGRYLDLDRTATGLYEIDFNRSYHPLCYYNSVYDCPYPPRENRLTMEIRAGERMKS
jgi:uncharacterized protein (DUF1684 family)